MKCGICNHTEYKVLFYKYGIDNKKYKIIQCKQCKVVQTNPKPTDTYFLYGKHYFETRTDRGYNQYTSLEVKKQLLKVWELNLKDLNFYKYEKKFFLNKNQTPKLLDIGCAAGFFLEYMKNRNWEVEGIEISREIAQYARSQKGIRVFISDFLKYPFPSENHYDCITLWASIEHFKDPVQVLQKIYRLLKKDGLLIISTCRWGMIAQLKKDKWRFMNVPEHLYFFNEKQLTTIVKNFNFQRVSYITYGSGFTSKKNMGFFYTIIKKFADTIVKQIGEGDMMAIMYKKLK